MGFINQNNNRSRKRLAEEAKLRYGVLRTLQGDDTRVPGQQGTRKRRRSVEGLYGGDCTPEERSTKIARLLKRLPFSSSYATDNDSDGASHKYLTQLLLNGDACMDIDSSDLQATQNGLQGTIAGPRTTLFSLPLELIHEIFLLSGNLELPNSSRKLHSILTGSRYLEARMLLSISTPVRPKNEKKKKHNNNHKSSQDDQEENIVRVLNSKFLAFKFVTHDLLKDLKIRYTGPDFPVNDDGKDPVSESDIASVPIPDFQLLAPTNRAVSLYLYFLSQPNCVRSTDTNTQSIFINMCIQAGHLEQACQMLDTKNVATDETSVKLVIDYLNGNAVLPPNRNTGVEATSNNITTTRNGSEADYNGRLYMKLLKKAAAAVWNTNVLNSDIVWEGVFLTQNEEAMDMLRRAGGMPSLQALSFGMSQQSQRPSYQPHAAVSK